MLEHMFGAATCSFPGCDRVRRTRGLCQTHYVQQRRTGSLWPIGTIRRQRRRCDFERCDKLAVNKGLCQGHHQQRKKGQPLRPLRPFYGRNGPCRFEGCIKPRVAGGYCAGHAAQYYSGRPLAPLFRPKKDAISRGARIGITRSATVKAIVGSYEQVSHSDRFDQSWDDTSIEVTSCSSNRGILTLAETAMSPSTQRSWQRCSADHFTASRKCTIEMGSVMTTGQKTLNCGRAGCNRPGAESAT
jgi:hypothetical protein